jgi:DNA-binding CsgD family transcriptional regulator
MTRNRGEVGDVGRGMTGPQLPIVGRVAELEAIQSACRRVGKAGAIVVISGEEGVGKSRLVAEAVAIAGAEDFGMAVGTCAEGSNAPYGPVVAVLRRWLRGRGPDEVERCFQGTARLASVLLPELPSLAPVARDRLYPEDIDAALVELLMVRTRERERVLAIFEDIQWADPDTLRLISALRREAASAPLWLLLTCRSEELSPGKPATQLLSDLHRTGLCQEIRLGPLDAPDTRSLVVDASGSDPLDECVVAEIVRRSAGNPLYAEELARAAVSARPLAGADGHVGVSSPVPIPPTLAQAILQPARDLPGEVTACLCLAAVAGERFDAGLVAEAGGWELQDVLVWLARAQAVGLLVGVQEPPGHTYSFRHALIREAVESSLVAHERVELHRRVGETLASSVAAGARDPALAGVAADHLEVVGLRGDSAALARKAAAHAVHLRSLGTAAERFSQAIRLAKDERMQLELLVEAAESLVEYRDVDPQTFTAPGLVLARRLNEPSAEARLCVVVGRDYTWKDDFTAAREWTQRAVTLTAGRDPAGEVAARTRMLTIASMNEVPDGIRAGLAAGLAQAEEVGTATQRHPFRFHSAVNSAPSDVPARLRSVLDWVRSDAADEQHFTLGNGGDTLLALGFVDDGVTWLLRAIEISEPLDLRSTQMWQANLANAQALAGRYEEAQRLALETQEGCTGAIRRRSAQASIEVRIRHGNLDEAALHVERAFTVSCDSFASRMWGVVAQGLRARILVAADDERGMESGYLALEGMEAVSSSGWWHCSHWLVSPDLAAYLAKHEKRAELEALVDRLRKLTHTGYLNDEAALALAEGLLAQCQRRWGDAEGLLADARRRFQAMPQPAREAEALLALADTQWLSKRDDRGAGHAEQALAIARHIGSPPLGARASAALRRTGTRVRSQALPISVPPAGAQISPRELEVAQLVSLGMSNLAIGQRLGVSQHTVARHVSNILCKLDLRRREEIARWVGEQTSAVRYHLQPNGHSRG